jgi:lysophospholipase L1-like esterase
MAPPDDYPSVLASNTGMTVYNCGFEGCRMSDTHPDAAHKAFGAVAIADGIATGIWETQELYVEGIDSASYPQEHLDNLKKIDWSDVDYLTIFYGGNDAGNYVTIDNPQDPMDTTTYLGAARYVYDRIHTAYPGIRIIFFVPMYRYWLSEEKDSDEMTFEMGSETYHYYDWGDALLAASSSIGVPVVDMYRILGINASNRTTFLSEKDQTHPSEAGNKLIASKIEEKLFTEFISRRHSRPGR